MLRTDPFELGDAGAGALRHREIALDADEIESIPEPDALILLVPISGVGELAPIDLAHLRDQAPPVGLASGRRHLQFGAHRERLEPFALGQPRIVRINVR